MATTRRQSSTGASVKSNNRAARLEAQQKAKQRQDLLKWLGAGLLLAFVAILVVIFVANDDEDSTAVAGGPETVATVLPGPVIPSYIPLNGMTMGMETAPVTVVWYGDYQCPDCVRFARQSVPTLIDDYVDEGKIRLQINPYPLVGADADGTIDQNGGSFLAAEAAMCANDQGQFWTYHDLLYANYVSGSTASFTIERLKEIGKQAPGLNPDQFNVCIDSRNHSQAVLDMVTVARQANITETPVFTVNGKPVIGADYAELKAVIEEQIAGP